MAEIVDAAVDKAVGHKVVFGAEVDVDVDDVDLQSVDAVGIEQPVAVAGRRLDLDPEA